MGKGRADPFVELLEQRLLLRGVPGAQVIEGEFGAELKAGGAVMPHAFVVQQRGRHIAAVQGEGARKRPGVFKGLRGALAERRKQRVRRGPEQTDAALDPVVQRGTTVEPPLGGTNDRARQREQVVSTWMPRECLAYLAKDLLPADGKPVALLLLERRGVRL